MGIEDIKQKVGGAGVEKASDAGIEKAGDAVEAKTGGKGGTIVEKGEDAVDQRIGE
ncbi:hypothetical protein NUM3379_36140 [Kineococcus sp. NUM-3379]